MAVKPVPLTGSVLAWARADAGLSLGALAEALGASTAAVAEWEAEKTYPSTGQFRQLAKILGRPESFFFLARPPKTSPAAAAFRTNYGQGEWLSPDPKISQQLRLAQRVQAVVSWISEKLPEASPVIPQADTRQSAEKVAKSLSEWLSWTLQIQTQNTDARTSQILRQRLQDCGLTVLHLSFDAETSVRGFSLPHPIAPVMAINTKEHYRARLFSYIHELAHLAIHDDSLCLVRNDEGVERWCNEVAASFLIPEADFRRYVGEKFGAEKISSLGQVSALRGRYKVSLLAVALRLEKLGLASPGLYSSVSRSLEKRGNGGRPDPDRPQNRARVRLQTYGQHYVGSLLEAAESRILPETQVLDILNVSRSELADLRVLSQSGVEG
ncbi:XRE family transcriptional regulator [Streptomyces luomodiensis]|uniref:XRE family transcriptional regulator n=1 Tax=Streptomyces luomodiensis TaxID=3026192 RepID=A0ABY9UYC2_9ACTN|nr:XRE family transcriptional regulator [Streptomyces sp. SCA4-21]WNE97579.1 XRE family transcriptional regulator [Streptomyces sp. SCA4-21]